MAPQKISAAHSPNGTLCLPAGCAQLITPKLFQKTAFLQVVNEGIIVEIFRLPFYLNARGTNQADGVGDGRCRNDHVPIDDIFGVDVVRDLDRKSTRLNSSHVAI